jgi:aspartate racemase
MSGRYRRTIGIVGGLGPLAGANFYHQVVELAVAGGDEEHPEVVLISDPAIPSRLAHLTGRGPSPLPRLQAVARRLVDAGAGVIAIPSITTHAYRADVAAAVDVPVVDGVRATADALAKAGVVDPAVLATTSARRLGLLGPALADAGVQPRYPEPALQEQVQRIVEEVKAGGDLRSLGRALGALLDRAWARGAGGVLVGCTDMSPLVPHLGAPVDDGVVVYDVARFLARAVLAVAEAEAEAEVP